VKGRYTDLDGKKGRYTDLDGKKGGYTESITNFS
jgi:hypothetical protein